MKPLIGALRAQFGRFGPLRQASPGRPIKASLRWGYRELQTLLGLAHWPGEQHRDGSKPTVLVVSHEASATGAPILALNLCQALSTKYNVVALLLRGGDLKPHFQNCCTDVLQARLAFVNRRVIRRALNRIPGALTSDFALVNSVVSAPCLEPIRSNGIATVALVHEFAAYIRPWQTFEDLGLWSSAVVCSTQLTWTSVLRRCPSLEHVPMTVLPQGRCSLPQQPKGSLAHQNQRPSPGPSEGDAWRFLEGLQPGELLVLGAGEVQPRKGVDLFIATANLIKQLCPGQPIRFAWMGSGYDPDKDLNVSVWLRDQIERSGLENQLQMLGHSEAYKTVVERCDLFVVSSRLDPLPNVAIDAMLAGKPVLCFERACGIAELLRHHPDLHNTCVAPYFDCYRLAEKAMALLRDPQQREATGKRLRLLAEEWFRMPHYVRQLVGLGQASQAALHQEETDINTILASNSIDPSFLQFHPKLTKRKLAERYILSWRNGIHPRKPFSGFHPGIYREQCLPPGSHRDPLAHYLEANRPAGPWHAAVIRPSAPWTTASQLPAPDSVALHVHVFYPELLAPILHGLGGNTIQPDLYITFSKPELKSEIQAILDRYGHSHNYSQNHSPARLIEVPNRGRDIGPLVSELGLELDSRYRYHGHFHTKKSILIDSKVADQWRNFLLANLLGDSSQPMADLILATMQSDQQLGLVFPDDPGCIGWSANLESATILAEKLNLGPLPTAFNFPMGTMFWARQGALSRLYQLGIQWHDYPEEPLGYDGTILHAIERLLPLVATASGFRTSVTQIPGLSR